MEEGLEGGDGDCEEMLLQSARNGNLQIVKELLQKHTEGALRLSINCKGKGKANLGWSPLHLASYFGHKDVVEVLIEFGADVNVVNDVGDTPLHRAAYTGRVDVVMLLLKHDADVTVINAEGNTAKDLARNQQIQDLIAATETFEQRRVVEKFLKTAREGDTETLTAMLKGPNAPNINCADVFGNTALHCGAYRGQKEVVVLLLQNGIDTSITNAKGQVALDMARDIRTRQLLEVQPIKELQKHVQRFEGHIFKRSRFLGWKLYWCVLERGVLSLFRNRADATGGVKRKAYKYLDEAKILPRKEPPYSFSVHFSDSSSMVFSVAEDTSSHIAMQKWQNALQDHVAYSTYYIQRGTGDISDEEMDDFMPLGSMQDVLQNAQAYQRVLEKQVTETTELIRSAGGDRAANAKQATNAQLLGNMVQILDSSRDMCSALSHCLTVFTQQEEVRKLQLQQAMEKSRVLQEALHVLATEHHELERSVGGHTSPSVLYETDNEDDEFFDCDDEDEFNASGQFGSFRDHIKTSEGGDATDVLSSSPNTTQTIANGNLDSGEKSCWGGRCRLPVPMFSRNDFSVWSILKQCIGKELSKITMPVIFNEPLSFLQRITEYLEYAPLLVKAAQCHDPVQRMEYVAAFAVSASASNWDRLGKPFNPLLGETYELDREDLGFRMVSEQVSHHPPVSAFHVDSPSYRLHGAIHPKLKFWGKSVEVTPKGVITLTLTKFGETYTWQNINCCVHNIIVGKLWIEHYGVMEVLNHKTKHKAVINFKPSGWFGKDIHKVEGFIYDSEKKKLKALYGKWVEALYSYNMDTWENYNRALGKSPSSVTDSPAPSKKNGACKEEDQAEDGMQTLQVPDDDIVPSRGSSCDLNLHGQRLLWLAEPRPDHYAQYYSFTLFAMMLNEMQEKQRDKLPPTDSRLRPDIRVLEEGDIDKAADEKNRLEEKQRAARKERKRRKAEWSPRWFKWETSPHTGKEDWFFTGEYWNRKWDDCPDIF